MRSTLAIFALTAGALVMPQGVTTAIAPSATAPAGCSPTYPGTFEITVVNVTSSTKRSLAERQAAGVLTLKLAGGVLTDQAGRTGYIASNFQFQFDSPPQTGAIFTSGFSVCGNKSLALGGSAIFYQCESGGFFNLYDRSWAAQCSPIYLVAMGGAAPVTEATDGQGRASTVLSGVPVPVSISPDGQIVASSVPASISTRAPVSIQSDGQAFFTSAPASATISTATANGTVSMTAAPSQFTGAAASPIYGLGAMAAGVFGVVAML